MNEQINDLMYRAGLTAQGCWDEMDDYDREAIQKFAELIVKECFKVQVTSAVNRYGWDKYDDGTALLNHFGVTYE